MAKVQTITWRGKQYRVPSVRTLERWSYDGVAKTPDGRRVEPDAPDSWLVILGLM